MSVVVEAVYEEGVFRPLGRVPMAEHERVRLNVESLRAGEPGRRWGSYESVLKTFAEMPQDAGVDEAEWARIEAEMKAADLADQAKTLEEIRRPQGA